MAKLKLKIITPQKTVVEREATSVSVPTVDGEITILPRHAKLLTMLSEGIVSIHEDSSIEHFAVGGGFLETDGGELRILVSRAHGQNEIDEKQVREAMENAQKLMKENPKDEAKLHEAMAVVRRSVVDLKLLKRRKRSPNS
jgi:F-type H+-transporting ATPase subunit epsilon